MCGVLFYQGETKFHHQFSKALEELEHRGPDNSNKYEARYNDYEIYLGHTRLSIDLSETANQPMTIDGVTLIFNGEIFNYLELGRRLNLPNITSDSELLLRAYLEYGKDMLAMLNGFWAFVILDARSDQPQVFVSRDRLGVKPLYYSQSNGALVFSSEISPIFTLGIKEKRVDLCAVNDILASDYSGSSGHVIYEGIHEVPPGTFMQRPVNSDTVLDTAFVTFWRPDSRTSIESEAAALNRFDEVLEDVLTEWVRSDVPVALNLSGGIDSSLIAVALKKFGLNKKILAYTSVFPGEVFDESSWAELDR